MMCDVRVLLDRFVARVYAGMQFGTMTVFCVLPLYVDAYETDTDRLLARVRDVVRLQLICTRETCLDVLVCIPHVLSTQLHALVGKCVEYWVVLERGAAYVWASQLRRFFVHEFARAHDASVDSYGEGRDYVSGHFLWTRAYRTAGRLFRLLYAIHTARAWDMQLADERDDPYDDMVRLIVWLRTSARTVDMQEWVCMYLRSATASVVGDVLQPHEVATRMQRGIQYAMMVHKLQGPIASFKYTRSAGFPGVRVLGLLPKNKMCMARACVLAGHGTAGKMYFCAQTHPAMDDTRISVRSHSSKHTSEVIATIVVPADTRNDVCIYYE